MARSKDIIFLLGAGASADAGIPVSAEMIEQLEKIVEKKDRLSLYNHVKSAIYFSAGLRGKYGRDVSYNIETLANTLYELERNEEHPLYPFIASWNSRFVSLAGVNFCHIRSFRREILEQLKSWVCPEDSTTARYYSGLATLQADLNYPLHIFSLNYDLSIEKLTSSDFRVETGFEGFGPQFPWDWRRFDSPESSNNPLPQIFLYKIHGSINWKRDPNTKQLFSVDQIQNVDADKMELIFGREFKMEAADPYLFFAYQFRNLSLETRLIVIIGYGFGDPHINKMLSQSITADRNRRVVVVQRCSAQDAPNKVGEIGRLLELSDDQRAQIIVLPDSAKSFLEMTDLSRVLQEQIPLLEDAPF